jgi:undecaprenyl-diphosphatase
VTVSVLGLVNRADERVFAAHMVSGLAEPAVVFPLLAVAGVLTARHGGWRQAVTPLAVVAGGAAARTRLSRVIARPRPPRDAWLIEPDGFSLPSKHTTLAALTAGAVVRAFGVRGPAVEAAPLLAAAGVGASRVCLGVHWPTDVLAGWLFADAWLRLTALCGPGREAAGAVQ